MEHIEKLVKPHTVGSCAAQTSKQSSLVTREAGVKHVIVRMAMNSLTHFHGIHAVIIVPALLRDVIVFVRYYPDFP